MSVNLFEEKNVRDTGTYICPYLGFIRDGSPGCSIHSSNSIKNLRDISFFGEKICSSYHCPASEILNEKYKFILISYVDDWFLYCLAIIDPESFIWISDTIHHFINIDPKNISITKQLFKEALNIHLKYLLLYEGPIFYYSISEYNLNKNNFSLKSNTVKIKIEQNEIIKGIKKM